MRAARRSIPTLRPFAFGRGHARGELEQAVREHRKRAAAAKGVEDLIERAAPGLPGAGAGCDRGGGIRRLVTYQDRRYAALFLDRLKGFDGELVRDVARHLAVRMSFEDVIRVAQAKTSRERMARVRAEVRAKAHEPVGITEHFKPGNEEIAAILPPGLARWLMARRKFHLSMHVRSTTIWGFARLRFLAGLRWWRPHTYRYARSRPRSSAGWPRSGRHRRSVSISRARSPSRHG